MAAKTVEKSTINMDLTPSMNVFTLRRQLIDEYSDYIKSFIHIKDAKIAEKVSDELKAGFLWPDPLIQLNPSFEPGATIEDLVGAGTLHQECKKIFRKGKSEKDPNGTVLRLHRHQEEAIQAARAGNNYILTTGTGSGKSLAYIVPIVDHILRTGSGKGIRAVVIYPMNALANSQEGELQKFLCFGYPNKKGPVTFARYTGQENDEKRQQIIANPPDILLTNYVMLELLLTRPYERALISSAKDLRFLVLDELHTYRGRQGADVAMLVRRASQAFGSKRIQYVGTSATIAGPGTFEEQQAEVAKIATTIFGALVQPENIIGETVRRSTPERNLTDPAFLEALKKRVKDRSAKPPSKYSDFVNDPLSIWIENTFGIVTEPTTRRLVRATPMSITSDTGAAKKLSDITGVPLSDCVELIERQLLASYGSEPNPDTGFPVFAFRLHQFISRGDTIYSSIEREDTRYLTVHGQQYVPGNRDKILMPLVFCRSCGQEYYCVRSTIDKESRMRRYEQRELSDLADGDDEEFEGDDTRPGFLFINSKDPWPEGGQDLLDRLPEDWLEEHRGNIRIKSNRHDWLPIPVRIGTNGIENETGTNAHFIWAPFRFCLSCGISFDFRQKSDFAKLTSLATEGRSTATTILGLSAIRYLRNDKTLRERAKKLLSFTDNRQDASLQAGHFNDFVETGLLRSALYKAIEKAGAEGLRYDDVVQNVFDALELPLEYYAADPDVRFRALDETKKALRSVLGYRLYRDLKRGWRITAPNLEQCGLLEIKYLSLEEVCEAQDLWQNRHPALASASAKTRTKIAKVLLDFMRRELAIKVEYLDQQRQEQIQQQSAQRLIAPWAIDENERMEHAAILYARPVRPGDYGGNVFLSPRGGFGQYLRRSQTFPEYGQRLSLAETQDICLQLLEGLRAAGLTEIVSEPRSEDEVPGYQIPASALVWAVGDGTKPFFDPIRVPRFPETGGRTNPFFIHYYKSIASDGKGLEAREHTAQVQYEERIRREDSFREGKLPILFCSPTMELGVDIAELNAVNMRNVPPTPANYAQRSGRAGRSGQPALVFTYCSTFSSHDQYFFKRPDLMVAGVVKPPRLDLTNEDLIRSHIHAIWLAQTGIDLGKSLVEILNLDGEQPSLVFKDSVKDSLASVTAKNHASQRAGLILDSLREQLNIADWYTEKWLNEILTQAVLQLDHACDRWRDLYRAADRQREFQHRIITDHTRSQDDRARARRLRAEAESQINLLTEAHNAIESDFYSYRYFASEGFLPGYNFPRLPLSAFIPGRRQKKGRDEFLSRPRFLAVSEFGPRAIVYHEGSRFRINKVILPVSDPSEGADIVTSSVKQCHVCGYLHPISAGEGPDLCERCKTSLEIPLRDLFRLQNVATKRADKINSDEEERLRLGYEIRTGIRFIEHNGMLSCRVGKIQCGDNCIASLTYGHAATIWRVNLGWTRRADRNQHGFILDTERGYWASNQQDTEDDAQDPLSNRTRRVIPYVEDRKNSLLLEPTEPLDHSVLISLQAALKNAIQIEFQLEESEIAAERLPSRDNPNLILFFEASEGGAGVLRRLIDDPNALNNVAKRALQLCHFDPQTGNDFRRAPRSKEDCEAACYDCLMNYGNQSDHQILDRQKIKTYLMKLAGAKMTASPISISRSEHLERLLRQCQSGLEKKWLQFLDKDVLRLPSHAQQFIQNCKTRPDFLYEASLVAIYIDGPHHEYPDRQERDEKQTSLMEDAGYTVIRFKQYETWSEVIRKYPNVFGNSKAKV